MISPSRNTGRHFRRRGPNIRRRALSLALPAVLIFSISGLAAAAADNSAASIAGSFGDACRDFSTHASKDISHIELRYADGRVAKHETIDSPDHSIDGTAGDALESASVKSGTTVQTFTCPRTNAPPTAILEVETRADCFYFGTYLYCHPEPPFTVWTRTPEGAVQFPFTDWPSQFPATFSFRGTSSTDPNDDITSWSIDFAAGASASGSWSAEPPTEVAHAYASVSASPTVTLTVTDSAGQSDSDSMTLLFIDARPD